MPSSGFYESKSVDIFLLRPDILIINSFNDEVACGEPTAVVVGVWAGGDAVGQLAVFIDSDVVEPDAVPAEALSAISRGLVDVEGVYAVIIAGTPFEAA